jgi:hypothetical protein
MDWQTKRNGRGERDAARVPWWAVGAWAGGEGNQYRICLLYLNRVQPDPSPHFQPTTVIIYYGHWRRI